VVLLSPRPSAIRTNVKVPERALHRAHSVLGTVPGLPSDTYLIPVQDLSCVVVITRLPTQDAFHPRSNTIRQAASLGTLQEPQHGQEERLRVTLPIFFFFFFFFSQAFTGVVTTIWNMKLPEPGGVMERTGRKHAPRAFGLDNVYGE
jgi:hypothetical protein